jgi:predicted component of type VI protein secretion system
MVSREHARIERRRGKFYLVDKSINGTHVQTPFGTFYVRREDILLVGHGRISLGRDLEEAGDVITYESCE